MVDFLLELASVTEKKVSREELYKEDESADLNGATLPCGREPVLRK